jgi:DNA-binding XRE family transcriptional regulator
MQKVLMTLESLRINAGYTQLEAGILIGVSAHCIKRWERDNTQMPMDAVKKISSLYHVKKECIYFGNKKDFQAKMRQEASQFNKEESP